jgi:hypothetical protein
MSMAKEINTPEKSKEENQEKVPEYMNTAFFQMKYLKIVTNKYRLLLIFWFQLIIKG